MELVAASLADKPRLLALVLQEAGRRARRTVRTSPLVRWRHATGVPDAILPVPPMLLVGDAREAEAIYSGTFRLAGRAVETGGRSPFAIEPPSPAWLAELHGFEWLRHLEAAGDSLAGANARALVTDWTVLRAHSDDAIVRDPDIAARRALAFMRGSAFLLEEADAGFGRRFGRALAGELRFLRQVAPEARDGLPRLRARIALAYGALCTVAGGMAVRLAARNLSDELDAQVFPDGVHVSRDPAAIVALLAILLPLPQLFDAENHPVPKSLVTAIDRMLPMLRFFRHGDGALALFNGSGAADNRLLTQLLRHDETLGEPLSFARQGGYARLSAGGTTLVADVGLPPPPALSGQAHAGTLAFELSSGARRFIVNCGAATGARSELQQMARATAAHSTLTLADHSSSRFRTSGAMRRLLGTPLLGGPEHVPATLEGENGGMRLVCAQDGYAEAFGLVHERTIFLNREGTLVEGVDRLSGSPRNLKPAERAAIRFHLHPNVRAEREAEGGVRLTATNGECWSFHADRPASIDDSVFLGHPDGPRASRQIVVEFDPRSRADVAWSFLKRRNGACPTADSIAGHSPARC